MKRAFSVFLAFLMVTLSLCTFTAAAADTEKGAPTAFNATDGLFVHAVLDSADADAWHKWQSAHDSYMYVSNNTEKYFFLPSSVKGNTVDIYNGYSVDVVINGVTIPSMQTESVSFNTGAGYNVYVNGTRYLVRFLKSNAEAAVYVNNPNADGNGTELHSYLKYDKARSAPATGAIVTPDGAVDNTAIKKIKGRGNTTWNPEKKGFNITYNAKVGIAGMAKNKKYSILANFQDDSLSRNRFLYDLSDAVGMPYASDSRFVDFYIDGFYWGCYQMCEKVEAKSLVTDVDDEAFLNEDGTLKNDFGFIAEVDASAGSDDYWFYAANGTKVTLKAPEIEPGQPYYDEVKAYCKRKFDEFAAASANPDSDLSRYADIESLTKFWLINELGKNWDSGVSSCFFTYTTDENGDYKFYGSPVWDYDNSLGNANGVSSDLNSMGVTDYTRYTGWWCKYKGKSRYESVSAGNLINQFAVHKQTTAIAPEIWFKDFVPAIDHFSGKIYNAEIDRELMTAQEYYERISLSAANNYTSGWSIFTSGWIANHNSLSMIGFDADTRTSYTGETRTYNQNDFKDMFNYAADWMTCRAAWISGQWEKDYYGDMLYGDVNFDSSINIIDATAVQRIISKLLPDNYNRNSAADANCDGSVDVNDVTCIQKFIAKLDGFGSVGEKIGEKPEEALGDRQIIFTNSLAWSGTIYCHYWNDEQTTAWPGVEMTYYRQNEYDQPQYTITVPDWATYVMFDNGVGNYQTVKIPFDGSTRGFYVIDTVDSRGRYGYGTWNP